MNEIIHVKLKSLSLNQISMSQYIIPATLSSFATAYFILEHKGYFVKRRIPKFECRRREYNGLKIGVEKGRYVVNVYAYGTLEGKEVIFTKLLDRLLMRKTPKPLIEIMSNRLKRDYGVNLAKNDAGLIKVFEELYEELGLSI